MPNPHDFIVRESLLFFVILVTDNKFMAWVKPVTHNRASSLAAVLQEPTSTCVELPIKKAVSIGRKEFSTSELKLPDQTPGT
jgi:hypothetical protein